MRPIKFRYFDGNNMIMNPLSFGQNIPLDECEQFTGLLDKNGVEMYEGDVVNFGWLAIDNGEIGKGTIVFKEGSFKLETNGESEILSYFDHGRNIKVIGNIHEKVD